MALLSLNAETDYIDYWLEAISANREQRKITSVYSLVFCLNFMSELGQEFNKEIDYSEEQAEHFRCIFEDLAGPILKSI